MAENQTPTNSNASDEIDLGQLFQLIGNGFKKMFTFIGSIFEGIFHLIILFLLFVQRHFLKFAIAVLVGAIGGYFLDEYKTPKFVSRMVVEPNFNSAQQLYNNITFYNDLAKAKDSLALAKALNISVEKASSIREMEVESYSDENQKVKLFDEFIKELDTTTIKVLDFGAYLDNFNAIDARFHQITLTSTNNNVAKEIQATIIGSIVANDYFKMQKSINDENLELQKKIYNQQLTNLDSLQSLYTYVLKAEAGKEMQGTHINLAENGTGQNKELALVKERDILMGYLVRLNKERANKSEILNVISDFPTRGVKLDGLRNSYKLLLPLVLIGLVFGLLGLLELNKYLKNYKLQSE